jgi:ActR/RegA family two-component response regulator
MNELVLYIEKEKFLRQTLEAVFKSRGAKIHTEESLTEYFYLLDDLTPSRVILDLSSVSSEEVQKVIEMKKFKIILTGDSGQLAHYPENSIIKIVKPIIVLNIFEQIFEISRA